MYNLLVIKAYHNGEVVRVRIKSNPTTIWKYIYKQCVSHLLKNNICSWIENISTIADVHKTPFSSELAELTTPIVNDFYKI